MPRWTSWWPRWSKRTNSLAPEIAATKVARRGALLVAQITDVHIGTSPITVGNAARLDAVVAAVAEARPDVVLLTGDLTEGGREDDYRRLRAALEPLAPAILLPLVGNHDARASFRQVFETPDTPPDFIQYEWRWERGRVLVLDSTEPGRHAGAFCEARAAWLAERLQADPDTPTLIAIHHPPARSGVDWMDTDADGEWSRRLAEAMGAGGRVVSIVAGHLHRPAVLPFAAAPVIVAPSVAPQVALDLSRLDGRRPDGRALIVDAPPGFALHSWTEAGLATHFASTGSQPVLARFDPSTAAMVAAMTETQGRADPA